MIVKWVSFKFNNMEFGVLDKIVALNPKRYKFLKCILRYGIRDDVFFSSSSKDKIMEELKITRTTYFQRIKDMVDLEILKPMPHQQGTYVFNEEWIKILTLDVTLQGATRTKVAKNQRLNQFKHLK